MNEIMCSSLRQRADYTHKHNLKTGRHGWLRLTPAYSVKIVEEIISRVDAPSRILDPFCGTGTTALSSAYYGHDCVTLDINPFLVWLGQAKTQTYSKQVIASAKDACDNALELLATNAVDPVAPPPIHRIERWWDPVALSFLQTLRAAIETLTNVHSQERALLSIAFCRSLISLSNAAFNHQSMSFKGTSQHCRELNRDLAGTFRRDVLFVLDGAGENPRGSSTVACGDSRSVANCVDGLFDYVVTSPPYANRMSYIRELRPYMYWLGYLQNGRDAGELDWSAIGGTWGIATSRLSDWARESNHFASDALTSSLDKISHADNKSGEILSKYVARYFDDIWLHLESLTQSLSPGAKIHYIVGNSTFYGVLLPVEQIYAAMLVKLGFRDVDVRPIRKRNSKKELVEFDVSASWS